MKVGRTLTISFGEYDDDVKDFLSNQKNASAFIRHLVRAYMNGQQITGVNSSKPTQVADDENKTESNKDSNLEALRQLEL